MKKLSHTLIASLFAVLCLHWVSAQAQNAKVEDYGLLSIGSTSAPGAECQFDLSTTRIISKPKLSAKIDGCDFPHPDLFTFKGAKSAITVQFDFFMQANNKNVNKCNDPTPPHPYLFVIKTTTTTLTPQTFNWDQLLSTNVGEVVVPGVRLIDRTVGSGNQFHKPPGQLFSCARITLGN